MTSTRLAGGMVAIWVRIQASSALSLAMYAAALAR